MAAPFTVVPDDSHPDPPARRSWPLTGSASAGARHKEGVVRRQPLEASRSVVAPRVPQPRRRSSCSRYGTGMNSTDGRRWARRGYNFMRS